MSNSAPALPRHPARHRPFWVLLAAFVAVSGASAVRVWHREPTPTLDAELHGDSDEAQGALPRRLATLAAPEQLPFLLRAARDPSPGLRFAAIDALAALKSDSATRAVEQAFRDSASNVRQRALETLPDLNPKRGGALLLAGLHDDDTWIREAAAGQILARLHRQPGLIDRRAVPALVAALDDSSPVVSGFAMSALCKLTGKPWRARNVDTDAQKATVRARWQAWWQTAKQKWPADGAIAAAIVPLHPTRLDPAPAFSLPDTDGKPVSLAAQAGRVTLLNFWGTWCPPCQKEIPSLVKIDQAYRGRGVDVIGIALSETSRETLTAWCRSHHVRYRQAMATRDIQDAFGHIEEVPVSVLIDGRGRIRYRWEGERDFATFRAAIERLRNEDR